ncbi:prepilin-type N-terminal cleavage/methylation domain-containing protein [Microbacterium sp. STN6]|uniref:prepilin-type N-terminal cleavage/methylation domain-containing protein n=1 Tax=Microbacterium sp. STN6 TaxID=2995588 RepID=UPI002B1EC10B|nr:prepilin-type N-terminal cleavage/methylation domain-containing protein [Microbacterium sp. STN6]
MYFKTMAKLNARRNGLLAEDEKGFTLIELLVVIIIIGILAAIAIPVFLNQRTSAWKSSVESDLKNAAVAVETYGTGNNGSYTGFTDNDTVLDSPGDTLIKVSGGNHIKVHVVDANSYTITGWNDNISTGGQQYLSGSGGIQKWSDTQAHS